MSDAELSAIFTAILDILTVNNTAYSDEHGQMPAIAKARELVAAASTHKPGDSGSVNVW